MRQVMRQVILGAATGSAMIAAPAMAQRDLTMSCQSYESAGAVEMGYRGSFKAVGIRAAKVHASSSLTYAPVKITAPAGMLKPAPGAPELTHP